MEPRGWTLESTSEPEPLAQVCRQGLALTPGSVAEAHTPSPLNSWFNFQRVRLRLREADKQPCSPPFPSFPPGSGSLDVFGLSTIAALTAVRVQGVRVKHLHLNFAKF